MKDTTAIRTREDTPQISEKVKGKKSEFPALPCMRYNHRDHCKHTHYTWLFQSFVFLYWLPFWGAWFNSKESAMGYVPNTPEEQQAMLEHMGLSSMEDLLEPVPANVRLQRPLHLPLALPEPD